MKWMRFKIRTTSAAEDILVGSMQDIGLFGAQIEDHVPLTAAEKEQMFVDVLPDEPDDGSAVLSFYVEEQQDGTLKLEENGRECVRTPEEIKAAMEQKTAELKTYSDLIGDGTVTIEETEDIDWINNWKQYFHQFWIDDILVIPSWEKPEEEKKKPALTLHIDPGTAFGTGAHETTQLCIRQMRHYLTDQTRLLDLGTGSGILAITALKLGIKDATGTDLDPNSKPAIAENCAANGVDPARFRVILGNLIDDPKVQSKIGTQRYDIVLANILPVVLVPMTPHAVKALKPGGVYITSGIIDGAQQQVIDACEAAGLTVVDVGAQGEWHSVTAIKR